MSIVTNLNQVTARLVQKLKAIGDSNGEARDTMLRQVASDTVAKVTYRIHTQGLKSDGTAIGEYKPKYLRLRETKYNRTGDKKVILSLTGQMENDFGIVSAKANQYGLGFKNQLNADKAGWMEEKYGSIYDLTNEELDHANLVANDFIADYLNEAP